MTRFKQIKFLLPTFMMLLLVLPVAISSFISYQNTEIIELAIIEKEEMAQLGSRFENTFTDYEEKIEAFSQRNDFKLNHSSTNSDSSINFSQLPPSNDPALTTFYRETLSDLAEGDTYIVNLFIGASDGALYLHSIPDADLSQYDPRTTEWYQEAVTAGDTIWTQPYIDTATSRSIITVARPITENGEIIGVVGLDFDMAALAGLVRYDILISSLITVVVAIIIGLIIVFYFVRNINHNLQTVASEMDQLARGVITDEDVTVKGDNEFKQLANRVNDMKHQTRKMLLDIKRATDQVASQSQTLSQASEQVREGSEQIAATMEEISSGSETQANSASDLAMTMERFTHYVSDATNDANDIDERSTHVLTLSTDGTKQVKDSITQMKNIEAIVKEAVKKVEGLESKATEIGSIVGVIQDISEQTNLLALNAAIEAARAGEEGRGFAVVANEVRKLAEQVGASVTDITSIIDAIQHESKSVATSLHQGYDAVEHGSNQMNQTGQAFDTIKTSISDMVTSVSRIVDDLSKIKTETADMQKSVDDIAAVSEESAAAVEETAASAEETSSSMEEVSRSADELRLLSQELEADVNHFKL
ncbi:hypothetical protein GCM10012290_14910 [Halolactibacillus alkaliphilus]|uniref:Methyl-accepting chemotaxis protein n=1 Tax=Halolactibacillus alkaliphilus TaxID=442899 RepID=A0A511X1E5_9BACI|nr:methyl-accepting chemotaxis protein [Halolactibacillus alkaliphilus]GEN56769.1 hypothetical protein HAL01_12330 [Halolactibacillus alkaliphilus]GGN70777.1 hypothetical protein GCM10012290_14910 [Halolactibacillus alkaliphilus]SFO79686.1 methyl-accepting chemotaxis protein [Halolactibacillus alkaliphilus]